MARIYNYLLQQSKNPFTIIHSLDGYDEISLTNDTKVITNKGEILYTPEQLETAYGRTTGSIRRKYGGRSSKDIYEDYKGEGTWAQNAVVLANAAMALNCTGNYTSYNEAYEAAVESLEGGKAYQCLQKLIAIQ